MDAVRHRTGTPCLFVLVPERLVFVVLEFVDGGIYVYVCEFVSSLGSPCPHVHASSSTVRPASYAVQHPNGWGTNSHNGVIVVPFPLRFLRVWPFISTFACVRACPVRRFVRGPFVRRRRSIPFRLFSCSFPNSLPVAFPMTPSAMRIRSQAE